MAHYEDYFQRLKVKDYLRVGGDMVVLGSFTFGDAAIDVLSITGYITQAATTTLATAFTGYNNVVTCGVTHTGNVAAARTYVTTASGTAVTIANMFGLVARTTCLNAADKVTGTMTPFQAVLDLGTVDNSNPCNAWGICVTHTQTGTRAKIPVAFMRFTDSGYGGAAPTNYLFDLGGTGSEFPSGTTKIFYEHTLWVRANGSDKYLVLSDAENCISLSGTVGATGISISGSTTTAISLSADAVTGISITSGMSATNVISIAATASTAGINISGNCTTGIVIAAQTTAGITMTGGSAYKPIVIGTKSNSTGTSADGIKLTGATDQTGGVQIFCDDGNVAVSDVTSPLWTRYLLISDQTSGATQTGAYLQLKTYNTVSFTTGSITATKCFLQSAATTLVTSAEYAIINAGLSMEGNIVVGSGCRLSGIDINITDGGNSKTITDNATDSAALHIRAVSGSTCAWPVGIKINNGGITSGGKGIQIVGGTTQIPLIIGTKSNSTGSATDGIVLAGATDQTGGVQIFADDGNAAVSDITSPLWTRYLCIANQTSGATQTGAYFQLKTYNTISFQTGSITATKCFLQSTATTLTSGAEYAIINAGMSLEGTITNTSGRVSGIDININGASAIADDAADSAALHIRKVSGSTAVWPAAIIISSGGCTAGLVMGAKSSSAAIGHHIGVANSADTAGDKAIAVFCDDANATLASDAQGINSRCLILHAQAGAYAMTALRGHLRGVANVTPNAQKSFAGVDGYAEFSGTYTIGDGSNAVFMCGMTTTVELGGTPTIAAQSRICGILVNGAFTSAINGDTAPSVGVMYQKSGETYGYQFALGFHDGVSGMLSTTAGATTPTHKVAVWINGVGTRYIKLFSDS